MSNRLIIAIDGPSASGKGTLARRLAAHFGLPHLDTGLLYRAVGLKSHQTGRTPIETAANLQTSDLANPELRTDSAGQQASKVAAIPEVRDKLLNLQRKFAHQPSGAVLDGRDIGTVICPDAEVKIFVTASPEVRAKRRFLELQAAAGVMSLDEVLADVLARDARDRDRATAPMKPAEGALILDTSEMTIDEAVAAGVASARPDSAAGRPRSRAARRRWSR